MFSLYIHVHSFMFWIYRYCMLQYSGKKSIIQLHVYTNYLNRIYKWNIEIYFEAFENLYIFCEKSSVYSTCTCLHFYYERYLIQMYRDFIFIWSYFQIFVYKNLLFLHTHVYTITCTYVHWLYIIPVQMHSYTVIFREKKNKNKN